MPISDRKQSVLLRLYRRRHQIDQAIEALEQVREMRVKRQQPLNRLLSVYENTAPSNVVELDRYIRASRMRGFGMQ